MSKNTASSGSSSYDPIEGSSKATNDQTNNSESIKTFRNRTHSESSRLLAHSRSSSFGFSENVADENRDSQYSTKASASNEGANQYDNEGIRPVSTRHSSSHSGHASTYADCGRHSDDWLFKPMAKGVKTTVKTIFGTKEQGTKEQK